MPVQLTKLPFAMDALEPHKSRRTLEYHYGKHHKHYVDQLNQLIQGTSYEGEDMDEIMTASCGKDEEIYNNSAQAWNHEFFWKCLSGSSQAPSKNISKILNPDFGSLEGFKREFSEAAGKLFGSGWVWLVKDEEGKLAIRALPDAENPIQDGHTPLLACDVWEHAYYLDYQNERPRYLEHFWSVVNWETVERNLDLARQSLKSISSETSSRESSKGINRLL